MSMKFCTAIFVLFANFWLFSQSSDKPSDSEISSLPQWAQLMYSDNPNVFQVDVAYRDYYRTNTFIKTNHTQYYKRWRKSIKDFISEDGSIIYQSTNERMNERRQLMNNHSNSRAGNWTLNGPIDSYYDDASKSPRQNNVRSFTQSPSNPDILYAGTEPGEIYKSIDEGLNWVNMTLNDPLMGTVTAIAVHPTNPDIVFAGSGGHLFRSNDGGTNWISTGIQTGECNEIQFKPSNPNIILMAGNDGYYRSTDGGNVWSNLYTDRVYDIKFNAINDDIVYIVKRNPITNIAEFFLSNDGGIVFVQQTSGWHNSTDPGVNDRGARIAVTPANPNRVYAYLIGESKTGDNGFIGLYRSDDGGITWTLPNGPAGGPYTPAHPNLANGEGNNGHHQGFYNCAVMASSTNADEVLVGGTSMYKSNDGGLTFDFMGGYGNGLIGNYWTFKVDMQDFRVLGNTAWITTDGCIYRSEDFFSTTNYEIRNTGMHSSDYWGFGQGWNEDVTVGGLYHCGVHASFDNWGLGNQLVLSGGEPASGYVNPGESRRVYSSQGLGRIVPLNIGDPVTSFGFGINPNESYWAVESSELEFHPNLFSTACTGLDNELWMTEDFGVTFTKIAEFGNNVNDRVTYIEYSWSNPDIMYVCQQMASSNIGKLWKTIDAGSTWNEIILPLTSTTKAMLIQIDPLNSEHIYIAFETSGNGQKIYKSTDGGQVWTNLSTPILDNQNVHWINLAYGTDGGIYCATNHTIYYRNNNMTDWEDFGDGLPIKCNVNKALPFYRDSKIRIASYGKGIWESPLYEPTTEPIARIGVDKNYSTSRCPGDTITFDFVDLSVLDHNGASWEWQFQGGIPASSNSISESVSYMVPGTYLTTLTITDMSGNSDIDSHYVVIEPNDPNSILSEDFETVFVPLNFEIENYDGNITWAKSEDAGGFGLSSNSAIFRAFDYVDAGQYDDLITHLDLTYWSDPELSFDLAYARYAINYSDSMKVLVSLDCGQSYDTLYYLGGSDLATTADETSFFIPDSSQWRQESIDLSAYAGLDEIMIVFRGISGWGNNIYLDNINLNGVNFATLKEESFPALIYPNPLSKGQILNIKTSYAGNIEVMVIDMIGKIVSKSTQNSNFTIETSNLKAGSYLLWMKSENKISKSKFVVQ